jgi:hypothetical protein
MKKACPIMQRYKNSWASRLLAIQYFQNKCHNASENAKEAVLARASTAGGDEEDTSGMNSGEDNGKFGSDSEEEEGSDMSDEAAAAEVDDDNKDLLGSNTNEEDGREEDN